MKSWHFCLLYGVLIERVDSTPNEGDLLVVDVYGVGWHRHFRRWVWPWRPLNEVV